VVLAVLAQVYAIRIHHHCQSCHALARSKLNKHTERGSEREREKKEAKKSRREEEKKRRREERRREVKRREEKKG
jgi:hypothetical protein